MINKKKESTRSKRLVKNTAASIFYQVTALVCGFILPRLILRSYGSEVNGLVNSITQFLQVVTFLELGVGAVVQSALYKPLSEHDNENISRIIASASKFFRKLAYILTVYIIILIFAYPYFANQHFGFLYTAALIAVMGISSFSQYYFGVVDRLLLSADQRGYIQFTAQAITLILNTIACAVLIRFEGSIHMVKLTTSVIFLMRPLYLHFFVNRHYRINRRIQYTGEPIEQKWNGVAQHVAAVVLDSTDTIVLTLMADMTAVSIYSVYFLVVHGVKQLFMSMTNGFYSLIGELWAKQELDTLKSFFGFTEWFIHTGTVFLFGCTSVLIVPFVAIYTRDIVDASYYQPLFAYLLVGAHASHCLRLPYNIMILAAGHYRQTQSNYIIAAVLNIVISVVAVNQWGLIGVAIGTLFAMVYQTVWMALYDSKNLIKWPFGNFVKRIIVDGIIIVTSLFVCRFINITSASYIELFYVAIIKATVWAVVTIIVNLIFYREFLVSAIKRIKNGK